MFGCRIVSARRARWDRLARPVSCWLRNRWHWRRKRRVREHLRRCKQVARSLDQVEPADDPGVQRIAELAESLPGSRVLDLGYGRGEAVLAADRLQPARLRPLVAHACRFTDDGLRGRPDSSDVQGAVRARNDVLAAVREIVATRPKLPPLGL